MFSIPDSASPWRETWSRFDDGDAASLGELDLRYKYFSVGVEIAINGTEFFGGDIYVTLVDLALGFRSVAEDIIHGRSSVLSFAERDEVLQFRRIGAEVVVSSSARPLRALVATRELLDEIRQFLHRIYFVLTNEIVGLRDNSVVQEINASWIGVEVEDGDEMAGTGKDIFTVKVGGRAATSLKFFNKTGWIAYFAGTETEDARIVPVEGWDRATGAALVVDPELCALRPVTEFEQFNRLEKVDQVVAALPGGGWRAHWKKEGAEDVPLTMQVLAWLITANGKASAITIDASGYVSDADSADTFIPPGENLP